MSNTLDTGVQMKSERHAAPASSRAVRAHP
jgi:hypothetical protein